MQHYCGPHPAAPVLAALGEGRCGSHRLPAARLLLPCSVTCADHHRVVFELQPGCSPGMGRARSWRPQGQMPALRPAGRADPTQSAPKPGRHRPAASGHARPASRSRDFAFPAELFPGLPGTGRGRGAGAGTALRRRRGRSGAERGGRRALPAASVRGSAGACSGAGEEPQGRGGVRSCLGSAGAPQAVLREGAEQAGGGLSAPSPSCRCAPGMSRRHGAGLMGQARQDRGNLDPKRSPESSRKRGTLRMCLALSPELLLSRANSSSAGWGKGPVMVQCSLNCCPQLQRVAWEQQGAVAT